MQILTDDIRSSETNIAERSEITLTRALRARRARPPEAPESCFAAARAACVCQTSKTRVRARLKIRTRRLAHTASVAHTASSHSLAHTASRQGARSASEMQSCWLDKACVSTWLGEIRKA